MYQIGKGKLLKFCFFHSDHRNSTKTWMASLYSRLLASQYTTQETPTQWSDSSVYHISFVDNITNKHSNREKNKGHKLPESWRCLLLVPASNMRKIVQLTFTVLKRYPEAYESAQKQMWVPFAYKICSFSWMQLSELFAKETSFC